jgi:FlaA1/EpsC-like NDP-sugar epimerase
MSHDDITMFTNKRILIIGGTGSLGKGIVHRLISCRHGRPDSVTVFSRDEAKQLYMRRLFSDIVDKKILRFRIGDIRDFMAIQLALQNIDIVFNAAAMKQVPNCEYFPDEAVATNVTGPLNIIRAIAVNNLAVETVIGISTDKACHPVNVMGMTKALQERILTGANLHLHRTRLICTRYGNVLGSRGSVIPLFHRQIKAGGPVTITNAKMTRYFLSLEHAVDTLMATYRLGRPGDIFVPQIPAVQIRSLAECLISERPINIEVIGCRPGEKIHEILISQEEAERTIEVERYYVVRASLPELQDGPRKRSALMGEYSSQSNTMNRAELLDMLTHNRLRVEDAPDFGGFFEST